MMQTKPHATHVQPSTTELLILPNGEIFVHNLTPAMAALLVELNPADEPMRERAGLAATASAVPVTKRGTRNTEHETTPNTFE